MLDSLKLDRIDLRILSHLQRNGRVTNVDLADAVGLSPSPCLIHVKQLEKAGFIIGYGAQLQLEKLGNMQPVFTQVALSDHRREDFANFEAHISGGAPHNMLNAREKRNFCRFPDYFTHIPARRPRLT